MKEIEIIKEQINKMLEKGLIYRVREGVYMHLNKGEYFFIEIKGDLK